MWSTRSSLAALLLGSDTWVNERWASYPAIMGGYRRLLGELPPEVARRVAWQNAAELFGLPAKKE